MPTPVDPPQPATGFGVAGVRTGNGTGLSGNTLWGGNGAPAATLGTNGDFYIRHDTPGTANQRLYTKSAGSWVALAV